MISRLLTFRRGFTLPMVMIMSLSVLVVITALLAVTTSSYGGYFTDHYQELADEAAEAGTAYATSCLTLSSHKQTWGPAKGNANLSPANMCDGTVASGNSKYLYVDSQIRTYFTVGDLDYSDNFSAQISATGYAEVLRTNGTVLKTYSSTQRKVVTWPTETNSTMVSSGRYFTCAVVNYRAYCWGHDVRGQLGNGLYDGGDINAKSSIDSQVPVKVYQETGVLAGENVIKVFAAGYHACALTQSGKMFCWGYNGFGQLGDGTTNDSSVPVQVGGLLASKNITDISGTAYGSCAIADGKIYCWGEDSMGTVGNGSTTTRVTTPTLVQTGSGGLPSNYTATKLANAGGDSYTNCAIADGKAYCWGNNKSGQIGDGTITTYTSDYWSGTCKIGSNNNKLKPTLVTNSAIAGKTVTSISTDGALNCDDPLGKQASTATGGHTCAIANNSVYCWGENGLGQLGDGTNAIKTSPVAVNTGNSSAIKGKSMNDVRAGTNHTCASGGGAVYCWGQGKYGQLGNSTWNTYSTYPVAVTKDSTALDGTNVQSLGGGVNRGCAVIDTGRTFCWGVNTDGQLGDGTMNNRNLPTESLFLRPTNNQYLF